MTRPSEEARAWLQGEPELEEMLGDPIVLLVMQRDGLTPQSVRRILRASGDRLLATPAFEGVAVRSGPVPMPER